MKYKFTNVYRASDRVSQYLIKHVIYRDDLPNTNEEVFFRIILFKIFNKISTWETLEDILSPITWENYSFEEYNKVLSYIMRDQPIYSNAYMMPSGESHWGYSRKHENHLKMIEDMMKYEMPNRLSSALNMKRAYDLLISFPSIGPFLAYQFIIDINYSEITQFGENQFVVPGPGALNGMEKCFNMHNFTSTSKEYLIRSMQDKQEREFERLELNFKTLWGRPLQLIDCQNLFCELDKYSRVARPDIKIKNGRTRIKQLFKMNKDPLIPWFPPKWKINGA